MKMTDKLKEKLLFLAFYTSLLACITGSIFGTFAWYQYSSRAGVAYEGTAIGDENSIQVGLYSEDRLQDFAEKYNLIEDDSIYENGYVYWSYNQALSGTVISEFNLIKGYSSNFAAPCSTGSYETGNAISLKSAPYHLENTEFETAQHNRYTYLPLVFSGMPEDEVVLQNANYDCDTEIGNSFRVAFDNPSNSTDSFVLAPAYSQNGSIDVAGILNLNKDEYYDSVNGYEHVYGEYTDLVENSEPYGSNEEMIPLEDCTTFVANHKEGVIGYSFNPKTSRYLCLNNVLLNRRLLTIDSNGYGRLNISVFLEGWDRSCVDSMVGSQYNLTMEFTSGGN